MQTLEKIEAALKEIDPRTYYGTAAKIGRDEPWDYTVFGRESATMNANYTSLTEVYPVAVIRENYVPESMEDAVLAAMRTIPGIKPTGDVVYDYMVKPGTTDIVEMMIIRFQRSRKIDI